MITQCLLPEAGVYELDDRLILYLTHTNLSNNGRGLREGAEIEVSNAHLLKITNPLWKVSLYKETSSIINFLFPENVWVLLLPTW